VRKGGGLSPVLYRTYQEQSNGRSRAPGARGSGGGSRAKIEVGIHPNLVTERAAPDAFCAWVGDASTDGGGPPGQDERHEAPSPPEHLPQASVRIAS